MSYQSSCSKAIHVPWPLADACSQTYFSNAADRFIIATGTDEGKDSRIVLWDTTQDTALLPYPGNCKFNTSSEQRPSAQMDTTDKRPSGSWPIWTTLGTAALLLSWRWMGNL